MKKSPGEAAITSAALKGAHVSPQVLVATVILHRDGRANNKETRLLKLQEDKEDFYKTVIEIVVQKDSMDFIFKSR